MLPRLCLRPSCFQQLSKEKVESFGKFLQCIITTLCLQHRIALRNQTWFQNLKHARFVISDQDRAQTHLPSTCAPALLISCSALSEEKPAEDK